MCISVSTSTNSWSISGPDVKEAPMLQLLPCGTSECQALKNKNNLFMTIALPSQHTRNRDRDGDKITEFSESNGRHLRTPGSEQYWNPSDKQSDFKRGHVLWLWPILPGSYSLNPLFSMSPESFLLLHKIWPVHIWTKQVSNLLPACRKLTAQSYSSFLTVSGPYHPSWWFFGQENSLKNIVNFLWISVLQK